MIPLPQMKDAQVRVVGLGPAGLAAAKALTMAGAEVTVWDDDADRRALTDLAAKGPRASVDGLHQVVLCDGGIAAAAKSILPRAKDAGVEVVTDLDLFADALAAFDVPPRIVGVTGLKPTGVAPIIARVLAETGEAAVHGGGMGLPCLALSEEENGIYVLELPIARLAAAKRFHADVSVVHGLAMRADSAGLDAVMRAIMRLFRQQRATDAAVIAVDDVVGQKLCTALQSGSVGTITRSEVIPVSGKASLGHGVFVLGARGYAAREGRTQNLGDLSRAPAFGEGEKACEAASAIAACLSLGLAPELIIKALHTVPGDEGPDLPLQKTAHG